jgi:hypothetical protein
MALDDYTNAVYQSKSPGDHGISIMSSRDMWTFFACFVRSWQRVTQVLEGTNRETMMAMIQFRNFRAEEGWFTRSICRWTALGTYKQGVSLGIYRV